LSAKSTFKQKQKNNQNIKNHALACLEKKKENLLEKARENSFIIVLLVCLCIEKLMEK